MAFPDFPILIEAKGVVAVRFTFQIKVIIAFAMVIAIRIRAKVR